MALNEKATNISFDFRFRTDDMVMVEAPNVNPTMKCVTDVFWHANMLDAAETNKCVIEVDMIFIKIHLWLVREGVAVPCHAADGGIVACTRISKYK